MLDIITRFAPSPTGSLHIGGARTALFNWLYARHHGGKFFLRIEDTDKVRSTKSALENIIHGLSWLGLNHDGDIIYQSQRIARHIQVANLLLKMNKAYYCYCHDHDIIQQKIRARAEHRIYKHICSSNPTSSIKPVIRFRASQSNEILFNDQIYGQMKIDNSQSDDIVILRSDNTPTYIFAVVIDDYDYGITDIIRGSDHLSNTFKQILIYQALDFKIPRFAHIPLIHGEEGNKLSKRAGSTSICEYKKMGILPHAMFNYLLRLSWSHGNDEIISSQQAITWFNLESIGRSPARFNSKKLAYLNHYYINNMCNEDILAWILSQYILNDQKKKYLLQGLTELKKRVNYLTELLEIGKFYIQDTPLILSEAAQQIIHSHFEIIELISQLLLAVNSENWNKSFLSVQIQVLAENHKITIRDIYQICRASLTGIINAPGILEIMVILGKDECLRRLCAIENKF
ncbi:glutamate--tRNA ligase [Wolbachia endosymbiont of Howardula sp.]|uniref:glutamate--tRNA ligase n=1 Tax=Wolbachia endosymbiont of Howardula sp. TaxID=2916816 RepID=UPI00217D0E31|nr:glutamate--tRNA ligase [Wolbachia endosymbiont of Howardula sp.]UWI83012.1 glutamate--tRNA ligase [Wolbachia endosymbiont of Howardula sp.]